MSTEEMLAKFAKGDIPDTPEFARWMVLSNAKRKPG